MIPKVAQWCVLLLFFCNLTAEGQNLTDSTARLEGPYEDHLQQEIPFGRRSYYLAPWRAYMDTWPASRFLQCPGVNFNVDASDAEATAKVLSDAGFRTARIEVGWGSFSYDDSTKLNDFENLKTRLQALQKNGIRPLMLLNANSGYPCPIQSVRVKVTQDAPIGAREITFDKTDGIRPGYTGLRGMDYQIGYPLITKVDAATGRCELSAPLPKAVPKGDIELATLKYQPFAGTVAADGTPNPAAQETLDGWKTYVSALCDAVKTALGTQNAPDAGFDLEVWNELTFGSHFLDDKNYYNPPRTWKEPLSYSAYGTTRQGSEIILPVTVDWVNDAEHHLPGVKVIDGLSNQRPWENGRDMWLLQTGFSRHYYTGINPDKWNGGGGLLSPATETNLNSGPVNALGLPDGTPDGKDWYTVVPGTFFIPTLTINMPEYWHYGYKTEFMTRDVQPFPGPWPGHQRFSHPGTGRPAEVWMTEFNFWRQPWADQLMKQTGVSRDDPRLHALMLHTGAKALLRSFVFHSHKGVHTITVYAARESDSGFTVLPEAFFNALKASKGALTPAVRAQVGEQVQDIGRVTKLMQSGQPLETARPLHVERLVEHSPRLVFKGDGTPQHPDRWNRDNFACLPFQLDASRYAVGFYVVTRDMTHVWNPDKDALDPTRYDMPEQSFDLTLSNVRGTGIKVSIFDPMTNRTLPVPILASTPTTLSVRLATVDYPRFLMIEESKPGPLILTPQLQSAPRLNEPDWANIRFATNIPVTAQLSHGALPDRGQDQPERLRPVVRPSPMIRRALPVPPVPSLTVYGSGITLPPNTGVQVIVKSDGLEARWPLWGYDVQGVARFAPIKTVVQTPAPAADVRVPPLPDDERATIYSTHLPEGLEWQEADGRRTLQLGTGAGAVEVSLEPKWTTHVAAPAKQDAPSDFVLRVLPEVSTLDKLDIQRVEWAGFPAWRAELTLSPIAHPGLIQTRQRFFLLPYRWGLLVLAFKGNDEGFRTQSGVMDQIAAGVMASIEP